MTFGLTRGEILLVAFIFGLIYLAGLLPRIAAWLTKGDAPDGSGPAAAVDDERRTVPKGD